MSGRTAGGLSRAGDLLHHHFLPLVVAAYALAAAAPAAGRWLRDCDLARGGAVGPPGLPLTGLLLAALLFNAALAVDPRGLAGVVRRPKLLLAGLLANLLVPLGLVAAAAVGVRAWPDPAEADCLLAGLAVVAAMPVAGSAAAWSQAADGNLALSLGLVVGSTLLSPLTTPLVLAAVEGAAGGGAGTALAAIAGQPAGGFLAAWVVVPTVAGLAARWAVGGGWVGRHKPALRAAGSMAVLVLCYANATAALPQLARQPDWDFLALAAGAAAGLCGGAFAAGRAVARGLGAGPADAAALVYGLGMSNNGTGLALAAALEVPAEAVLPVLAYNLLQHLTAGAVSRRWPVRRPADAAS